MLPQCDLYFKNWWEKGARGGPSESLNKTKPHFLITVVKALKISEYIYNAGNLTKA
jgi:hypothetical protein